MIKIPSNAKFNKWQLKVGTKIEKEHTTSTKKARHIAKQHLIEFPNYYTYLTKMEKMMSKK